jgi:hypothetical protein
VARGDLLAGVEDERRRPARLGDDPPDAAFHPALAARFAVFCQKDAHHDAHALKGAGEALEKEGPEHDRELVQVHVVLPGASVEHEGAQQHVLKQRVGDRLPDVPAGRGARTGAHEGGLAHEPGYPAEPVGLRREPRHDLRLEKREVVAESEHALPAGPEGDPRALLGAKRKLLPLDPQLAQDLAERRPPDSLRDEVGDGMQSDVVLAPVQAVEAVQSAHGVVALEDAYALSEVRQPNPRRQAGEPGSDDGDIVLRGRGAEHDAEGVWLGSAGRLGRPPCEAYGGGFRAERFESAPGGRKLPLATAPLRGHGRAAFTSGSRGRR